MTVWKGHGAGDCAWVGGGTHDVPRLVDGSYGAAMLARDGVVDGGDDVANTKPRLLCAEAGLDSGDDDSQTAQSVVDEGEAALAA
jgi:hypothetical protein